MLVEDGVEVVVVGARVAVEVSRQPGIGVIDAFCVVITLPELDWTDVGGDEDGGPQDRVKRGGENRRNCSLKFCTQFIVRYLFQNQHVYRYEYVMLYS